MNLIQTAEAIQGLCVKKGWSLSVAESCTGGYIASTITSQPGASQFFTGSVVSYSNSIKARVLEVDQNELELTGAVSPSVALQMATGVRQKFETTWSVSTTGVAGPGGGSEKTPKGTLCVGITGPDVVWKTQRVCEGEGREEFIKEASHWALTALLERMKENENKQALTS